MRTFAKCGTAAGLLAALAVVAVPSFAADKMMAPKMSSGKMMKSSKSMKSKSMKSSTMMSSDDTAMWKKMMMHMSNADKHTMAGMSASEKSVCMKMCKMKM